MQPGVRLLPAGRLCTGPEPGLLVVELPGIVAGVVVATAVVLDGTWVEVAGTEGLCVAEPEGVPSVFKQEQADDTRFGEPSQLK